MSPSTDAASETRRRQGQRRASNCTFTTRASPHDSQSWAGGPLGGEVSASVAVRRPARPLLFSSQRNRSGRILPAHRWRHICSLCSARNWHTSLCKVYFQFSSQGHKKPPVTWSGSPVFCSLRANVLCWASSKYCLFTSTPYTTPDSNVNLPDFNNHISLYPSNVSASADKTSQGLSLPSDT